MASPKVALRAYSSAAQKDFELVASTVETRVCYLAFLKAALTALK